MEYTFSHIINVVSREENPKLFEIQEKTALSFAQARKNLPSHVSVEVIAIVDKTFQGNCAFADKTVQLSRTVLEVHAFREKRALPIVNDILDAGIAAASGRHVIYSNTDIMLTPWFYPVVAHYLAKENDALVINRRRIPLALADEPYEVMLAHAGKVHSGWDCFVFPKELYSRFVKTNICTGIPMAGNDIFHNIFTFATHPALLANQHLTMHLGMDLVKKWGPQEYYDFNKREFNKLLKQLKPAMQIAKFPGAGLPFFRRHFRWLMNPTYDYPTMCSVDLKQLSVKRPAPRKPEIPGLAHRYYEWMIRRINFREED